MESLAERMRPRLSAPERLVGYAAKIWQRDLKIWREQHKFHIIFWGPPGAGKTTLAQMLAESSGLHVCHLSAVKHGVKEIREAAESYPGQILFIDEIHRLSKSQQDVLLPILEKNEIWMIGATTESPNVTLNPAIISRVRTLYVKAPSTDEVEKALLSGLKLLSTNNVTNDVWIKFVEGLIQNRIARMATGDVRIALNLLESVFHTNNITDAEDVLQNIPRAFTDKKHYDWVSAMIKSMRGSDPDAALFYAITALDSGEDPLFILRRCVIFASEDIGNADPQALGVAVNALHAFEAVGMPEGRIPLAQAVTYLSSTLKSNRSYLAIETVRAWRQAVEDNSPDALAPPRHITKAGSENYIYPHSRPNAFVHAQYLPLAVAEQKRKTGAAYIPSERGVENRLRQRLVELWQKEKSE